MKVAVVALVPLFSLLCLPGPARAQEDQVSSIVGELLSSAIPEERSAIISEILRRKPEPQKVLDLLRKGPTYEQPVKSGWQVRKLTYVDGVARPYHLYVPSTYDHTDPAPLLFHMHGGVSRPQLLTEEEMKGYRDWWKTEAEEWGILVAFPLGQTGATWWDETGALGVEGILNDLKRDLNVDEDRVFVTGFSDGGSGAFYLGFTHPTFFAGLIPLNGHPAVAAGASGRQLYPVNSKLRPWYVVNTQADQLYPSKTVIPFIQRMMEIDAQVRFTTYPGIGHQPAYRAEQGPVIAQWVFETKRVPLPKEIVWEAADLDLGRASWVTILELGDTPGAPLFPDVNVMSPEQGVRLGIYVDRAFEGTGVRIDRVVPGSLAEKATLAAGDVITKLDDAATADFSRLRAALGKKRPGDSIRIAWRRGEEEHAAEGKFPPFKPTPVFARGKPSGHIEVAVDGNKVVVKLNGVKRYALDVSPDLFDLDEEIVVSTNGKESFRAKVELDLGHLLRTHMRDRDRSMLFLGRIEVTVE